MRKLLRDALGRFKSIKVNLLDGQRRGEVVFRRVFFLLTMGMLLYLLLLTFVGRKDQEQAQIEIKPEKVEAKEVIEDKEEWVDGDRVTTKADGSVEVVPAENFMDSQVQTIRKFTQAYPGSRIDNEYFAYLDKYCSDETLRTVIAISVAESSMGKNSKRNSNWYGWFKGGNRNYDPSQEEMAKVICTGVEKYYLGIGSDNNKVKRYVGGDPTNWMKNFNWAYNQMET
ncbi:TPA: hypothetical protein DEP90_02835, partial [Patescibacteria group bacterium]|nr:hypothetical protein [Patescibacteria group bacterium]